MQRLFELGLVGKGLILIDSEELVARYNKCLQDIGVEPTMLKQFSIDGIGWSPEIAKEKNDKYYLSHGSPSNPYFIILVPEQRNKPIYFPLHSFDRDMMIQVFENAGDRIIEVTKDTAIWIHIDQGIDLYHKPHDVLMLNSVELGFHSSNGVMESSQKVHNMVREFISSDEKWSDTSFQSEIKNISQKHGDLRYRTMDIKNISYNNVMSFYTRAFGGVTVFREIGEQYPILVLHHDEYRTVNRENYPYLELSISDKKLLKIMLKNDLIELNLDYYKQENDLERIRRIMFFQFVSAYSKLENPEHDIMTVMESGSIFRRYLENMYIKGLISEDLIALKRIFKKYKKGNLVGVDDIPKSILGLLLHPKVGLKKSTKALVWQILTKIYPDDFMSLYAYDKEGFFHQYESWSDPLKTWVSKYLSYHYEPWMDH